MSCFANENNPSHFALVTHDVFSEQPASKLNILQNKRLLINPSHLSTK